MLRSSRDGDLRAAMVQRLLTLLSTSTEVPAGAHEIMPGDARIRAAVQDVVLPMVRDLGPDNMAVHPDGDLVARFGPPGDDGLLLQTYIVSQHGNLMENPHDARVRDEWPDYSGQVARGQGANQNKGPMAAVLAAVAIAQSTLQLRRPVFLTVNTEGKSSHDGSRRLIDDLGVRAGCGVIAFGTDLAVSVGNRGRVDVRVGIPGRSSHSSQPYPGFNPIVRAAQVVTALESAPLPNPHPDLGPATVTPFQLYFDPIAPHTIPQRGTMMVDRRLLPGETVDAAVDAVRRHLAEELDFEVTAAPGEHMLPAEVRPDEPVVRALLDRLGEVGVPARTMYSKNTFDAGYPCSRGIPTVMFGPGRRDFGERVTADEVVSIDDCWHAATALAGVIRSLCA